MHFTIKTKAWSSSQIADVELCLDYPSPPDGFSVDEWGGLTWLTPPAAAEEDLGESLLSDGRYIQHEDVISFQSSASNIRINQDPSAYPRLRLAVDWLIGFRQQALFLVDRYYDYEFRQQGSADEYDYEDYAL